MESIKKMVVLDYETIKPYLTPKNLIIFIVLGGFMSYTSNSPVLFSSMAMFVGVLYTSYLFAVGEQNGIDVFYATLPVKRKDVVAGRYAFIFLFSVFLFICATGLAVIMQLLLEQKVDISGAIISTFVVIMVYLLMESFQLPIFFKYGYIKGKNYTYIPLFAFFALISVGSTRILKHPRAQAVVENLLKKENLLIVIAALILTTTFCYILSYYIAKKNYIKREI